MYEQKNEVKLGNDREPREELAPLSLKLGLAQARKSVEEAKPEMAQAGKIGTRDLPTWGGSGRSDINQL